MARLEDMLERERVANRRKHWVRVVTACNSRCLFCLDMDTPRNVYLREADIRAELERGRSELGADKVILSGGEATLHPEFVSLIAHARSIGYSRVQTVTNGTQLADRSFMRACLDAGLGEITFSLHGHEPELHDRLTRTPGAFKKIMTAIMRALRDGRPIVNVDVVINKQNVAVIDKIVELCLSVGVTEFDLLHVIPQAEAFRMRDELFYDPREHLEKLHRVFRLNQHPRIVVWTNRFPIAFLEGLEDLIQDPHKMLDEVNGRRFQLRAYIDRGEPLSCREQERCKHCFIEPFCTSTDRVIARQRDELVDVWWVGTGAWTDPLPFGATLYGVEVERMSDLPAKASYARVHAVEPLAERAERLVLIVENEQQLQAWVAGGRLPPMVQLEIRLNRETAPWLLKHREALRMLLHRLRLHQPSWATLAEAAAQDVRDPASFFHALNLRVSVSGLPACLAPGAEIVPPLAILSSALFVEGRLSVHAVAEAHVSEHYRGKSLRCADCAVDDSCDGISINMIRDQGLRLASPLTESVSLPARTPRLSEGRLPEARAPTLPGFAGPVAERDPLAILADQKRARRSR